MGRARLTRAAAWIACAIVGLAATAHADPDPKAALADQLAGEAAAIDRAITAVAGKLAAVDDGRVRKLRAAYRVLRTARSARARAATRLVLERELAERRLLAHELALLRAAAARTAADTGALAALAAPPRIAPPARGEIVRRFGTFEHPRSGATLSRRGIDLEVEARTEVVAPADGTVRYAGAIRGLDAGVVIDHGDYLTVIAKLDELAVAAGAQLARGAPIGRAARRRVYLEVRAEVGPGGRPIDPEPLLDAGGRKTR